MLLTRPSELALSSPSPAMSDKKQTKSEVKGLISITLTTELVCQRNSSETAEQDFVKLCGYY